MEQLQSVQLPDTGPYSREMVPAARQRENGGLERQMQQGIREEVAYSYDPGQDRQRALMPVPVRESQQARDDSPYYLFSEDEINPFSGNLPAVNLEESKMRPRDAYNQLIPPQLPIAQKTTTRNLWQYTTDEIPLRGKVAQKR
jgi:hypothetical protein